jgi:hypothetical protein
MRVRSLFGSLVFVVASVLNPAYFAGCGTGEEEYQYDADDVLVLLDTANESYGSFEIASAGQRYRVALALEPAAEPTAQARLGLWGQTAFACGNRQLNATASACYDASSMALAGSVAVIRLDDDGETTVFDGPIKPSTLEVFGLKLSNCNIEIDFGIGNLSLNSHDGKHFDTSALNFYPAAR